MNSMQPKTMTMTMTIYLTLTLILALLCVTSTSAFAPIAPATWTTKTFEGLPTTHAAQSPPSTLTHLQLFKNIFGRNEKDDNDQEQETSDDSKVEQEQPTAIAMVDTDIDTNTDTNTNTEMNSNTITETVSSSTSQTTNEEQGTPTKKSEPEQDQEQDQGAGQDQEKKKEDRSMFFARIVKKIASPSAPSKEPVLESKAVPEASPVLVPEPVPVPEPLVESSPATVPTPATVVATIPTVVATKLTPTEKANALIAQAARARLEAEKMDIMLTINKIDKLETDLSKLKKRQASAAALASATKNDVSEKTDEEDASKQQQQQQKVFKKQQEQEEDMRRQLKALKKKLDGGKDEDDSSKEGSSRNILPTAEKKDLDTVLSAVVTETKATIANQTLSQNEIEARVEKFNAAPTFMRELVAKAAGMDLSSSPSSENDASASASTSTSTFNTTELVLKMFQDEKEARANEYAYSDGTMSSANGNVNPQLPIFTQDQIDEVLEAVRIVPQFVKNLYGDDMKNNDTAIALMMLEEEWQSGKLVVIPEITQKMIDEKLTEIRWVPEFLRGDNDTELALELIKADFRRNGGKPMEGSLQKKSNGVDASLPSKNPLLGEKGSTETSQPKSGGGLFGAFGEQQLKSDQDQMVESLFPESTRKEGQEINEGEAILFMSAVLAKDNVWAANGPPEKVSGGFLIRGSTKIETGAKLIEAIDANLAKEGRLKNKVNCFYVFDPTPVTGEQINEGERPPVLFLTGADVVRDAAPIQRSLVSSVAFGTIWYNSLLPFLLNDKYMKMADEQLALADASMPSSVDFLNDASFPLFVATVGIQAVHEIAHYVVAKNNGLNITIPTLVPSLGTGLTGGITSLQNPPKDKQALFDFAIAGPLAGIGVSIAMLVFGMAATSSMDAAAYASLPELPLNMIRQSSLVGGIIDSFSPGLLTVPDAALGTKALQETNIPLHPLAIAGYFGMMVNAANLLPVGRTDGGRMSLALFGRSGTQLVSFLTFVAMFIQGLTGSDLLLFFFSFVVFFQSELEIPQRNEVDDMDFSRVLLATGTGVLVLLTLIPM